MLFVSWNINGLAVRFSEIKELIGACSPDILCLQKARCRAEERTHFPIEGYQQLFSPQDCGAWSGVTVYAGINAGIPHRRIETPGLSENGHLQAFDCGSFVLLNTYVPYGNTSLEGAVEYRRHWDDYFHDLAVNLSRNLPIIICGDMNIVHTEYDSCERRLEFSRPNFTKWERDNFNRLLSGCDLVDPYRVLHPTEKKPTFYGAWRHLQIGNRIDYFLVSRSLFPFVIKAEILSDFGTGQSVPITLEITL